MHSGTEPLEGLIVERVLSWTTTAHPMPSSHRDMEPWKPADYAAVVSMCSSVSSTASQVVTGVVSGVAKAEARRIPNNRCQAWCDGTALQYTSRCCDGAEMVRTEHSRQRPILVHVSRLSEDLKRRPPSYIGP